MTDHYPEKIVGNSPLNLAIGTTTSRSSQGQERTSQQLKFGDYLTKRATDSSYTFRQHLRKIRGETEE